MKAEEARILPFSDVLALFDGQLRYWRTKYIEGMAPDDMEQEATMIIWRCHERVVAGQELSSSFEGFTNSAIRNRMIDLTKFASRRATMVPMEDVGTVRDDNSSGFTEAELRADLDRLPISQEARALIRSILDGKLRKLGKQHTELVKELEEAGLLRLLR